MKPSTVGPTTGARVSDDEQRTANLPERGVFLVLSDGSRIALADFAEHPDDYDSVLIAPPNYPPRYFGEYLRSREQLRARNRPKKPKPHRVIPVKRSSQ